MLAALATPTGCAPPDAATAARRADAAHHTVLFTWLAGHDPSALVVWHVDPAEVRTIVPDARVTAAAGDPCRQARQRHALLLIVAGPGRDRARVENCGFALAHDAGAAIVAPL